MAKAGLKKLSLLPVILLAAAAGALPAQAQDECPVSATPYGREDYFQMRLDMIDALEVLKDDARLICLVKKDAGLTEYRRVLARAANHHQDAALVGRVLNLPGLDQASDDYKTMAAAVFSSIAANAYNIDAIITDQLYEKFRDSRAHKMQALSFIFETAAINMPEPPNTAMTRMLVEDRAMLDEAAGRHIKDAENVQDVDPGRLERLRRLKADVLRP